MKNILLKSILVIAGLLFQFNLLIQAKSVTLHVAEAGALCSLINVNERDEITNLTLSGNLNGSDISCIRYMAGRSFSNGETNGKLVNLNMSNAKIVAGGGSYCQGGYTSNDAIGHYFLTNCYKLESVTLPNNITSIGDLTFNGCARLTHVTIPSSVTFIGHNAFDGCTGLKDLVLKDGDTTLKLEASYDGRSLFKDCPIETLHLGRSISSSSWAQTPFEGKTSLSSLTIGGVTAIGESAFKGCTELVNLTIGNNVTSIGKSAFYKCERLSSVIIPNKVVSIGESAFWGCKRLTDITIGNNVTTIGDNAFSECILLTSIIIPNKVDEFGKDAFSNCSSLKNVVFEDGKTVLFFGSKNSSFGNSPIENLHLGRNLSPSSGTPFKGNSTLISLTIGENVTAVEGFAFYGCSKLQNVVIGKDVASIGNSAFYNCNSLKNVTIPNNVKTIGSSAFFGCAGLANITIPNSVTSIESHAFYGCTGLTEVTIGGGVNTIGNHAFYNCSNLTKINAKNPIPATVGTDCFTYGVYNSSTKKTDYYKIADKCRLHIPKGSYSSYCTANVWKDFFDISEIEFAAIDFLPKGDTISIQSVPTGICIESMEIIPVSVYNLSGQCVYRDVINGSVEVSLKKGIYIVTTGSASHKIVVQ
jgi:hypothetical protein